MNPPTAAQTTDYEDFAAFPNPYLKATLDRLYSELFSAAKALRGELLDAFWQSIDELNIFRHDPTSTLNEAVPWKLVVLDGVHQKALLMRLRIDMFSIAKSLHGALLDEFWKSIDELRKRRPKKI